MHLCVENILYSRLEIYFYQLLELVEYCHRVHDIFHIFQPMTSIASMRNFDQRFIFVDFWNAMDIAIQ